MPAATFPVLLSPTDRRTHTLCPESVPWELVAPHARQAERNHGGQSLADLARRGGLDPVELLAVLDGRPYPWDAARADGPGTLKGCVLELLKRVGAFSRTAPYTAALAAGWTWACGACATANAATGPRPSRVQCRFCKTVHLTTEDVPTPAGAADPHVPEVPAPARHDRPPAAEHPARQ